MSMLKTILKKRLIKLVLSLSILLFIYVLISAYFYVSAVSENLSHSVLRLHVIANSDSQRDQEIKLNVRDSLINYMNSIVGDANSKDDAIRVVNNHLSDFEKIANQVLEESGANYKSEIALGNFKFPTKNYGDISFPAGFYDALEVKLGDSTGKNWWCILYPSLCFIKNDSSLVPQKSKEILQNSLPEEEFKLVSNKNNSNIKFKFKIVELINQNKLLISRK